MAPPSTRLMVTSTGMYIFSKVWGSIFLRSFGPKNAPTAAPPARRSIKVRSNFPSRKYPPIPVSELKMSTNTVVPTTIMAGRPKLYSPALTGGVPLMPNIPASNPDATPKREAIIRLGPVSMMGSFSLFSSFPVFEFLFLFQKLRTRE